MKSFLSLSAIVLVVAAPTPLLAETPNLYVGVASTGECVYYHGAHFQCGDLPRTDDCWTNTPMLSYTIGTDTVWAIADCRQGLLKEGGSSSGIIIKNMRPASNALRKVIQMACQPES